MGYALVWLVNTVVQLYIWVIIAGAILSWLVVFNVVNTRNRFVGAVHRFTEAVTRPVLAPFRRFIPPLGGVDVSFIVAFLVLQGARTYLLPLVFRPLIAAVG